MRSFFLIFSVRMENHSSTLTENQSCGAAAGITVETFPYGTIFTVSLWQLRDGRNFGAMSLNGGKLIGCGTTFLQGGCNEKTGTVYLNGRDNPANDARRPGQ